MFLPTSGFVVGGKFELLTELGRGGMGSVWHARDTTLHRDVAIKLIVRRADDPASEESRGRFEREARAAARLSSRHVVQIHEYGIDGDTPYIVMELLSGESLSSRLARCGRLPLDGVALLLAQMAKGLEAAHAAGIVHRDLKPANVFLAREDDGEVVKILDFGVAKAPDVDVQGDTTGTGQLVGSPHYMSPEQARGVRQIDGRSDVWSLGVIAYRAALGKKPFGGESLGDVIAQICFDPIPRATTVLPGLPPEIDLFFERALARDVAVRFQSARELAYAFSVVAGVPLADSHSLPRPTLGGRAAQIPIVAEGGGTLTHSGAMVSASALPRRRRAMWGAAGVGAGLAVLTVAGIFLHLRSRASEPEASVQGVPVSDEMEHAEAAASATATAPSASSSASAAALPSAVASAEAASASASLPAASSSASADRARAPKGEGAGASTIPNGGSGAGKTKAKPTWY